MGIVSKLKSGFIYETDFQNSIDSGWEVSPNDPSRYEVGGGSLKMNAGDSLLYLFFKQLTHETNFVLDMKNDYNPDKEGELAGIVVFSQTTDSIFLEEFFDTEKGIINSYPWLRLVRDGNAYYGYWSDDGKLWNLVGTNHFPDPAPKIGLFIDGNDKDLIVERVRIFRSPYVYINNAPPNTLLRLVDNEGVIDEKVVLDHYSKLAFPIPDAPFNGKFQWEDDGVTLKSAEIREIWGGDEFNFNISLDLYYTDEDGVYKRVDANHEEFLGYINSVRNAFGTFTHRDIDMVVKNPHDESFANVSVKLIDYRDTGHYTEFPELKLEGGEFSNTVELGDFEGQESKTFKLRINRVSESQYGVSEVYFGIQISAGFMGVSVDGG